MKVAATSGNSGPATAGSKGLNSGPLLMSCSSCHRALREPRINEFTAGCGSCRARALAAIGAHEESRDSGRMTPQYRGALDKLFGDGWQVGNQLTKDWATRMGQADQPEVIAVRPPRRNK